MEVVVVVSVVSVTDFCKMFGQTLLVVAPFPLSFQVCAIFALGNRLWSAFICPSFFTYVLSIVRGVLWHPSHFLLYFPL